MTAERTLSLRELNRALLARQLLLARPKLPVREAIGRVAGLQAQSLSPPFVGLWARIDGFREDDLRALIAAREVVRATMMRHTVHLVTTPDYVRLRGAIQPALERIWGGIARKRVTQEQLDVAVAAAQARFEQGPQTFADIRRVLAELLPDADHAALNYGVRSHVRVVALPGDGRWSYSGKAPFVLAEQWLGRPVPADTDPAELIRRHLAAFGPATLADIQMWSGLAGLRPVVDRLRPELRTFRDERGRELFDVPGAPLPDGDTPVPVRFTAEFDNALLAHADRSRIIADEYRPRVFNEPGNGRIPGTFLVDGFVAGRWRVERGRRGAELLLEPFRRLTRDERSALKAEAEPLLEFLEPGAAGRAVRFAAPA